MIIDTAGEEVTIIDFLQIEGGEEARRGELFPVSEDVLVKTMVPIGVGEE